MKVYISPSSQYNNKYEFGDYTEGQVCHGIGSAVYTRLTARGHDARVARTNLTYQERAAESNQYGPDVHLCIHTNAGGGDGTVVFCYPKNVNNPLVVSVYESVAKLSPGADDGIRPMTNLYEINKTKALCIYVEVEFHDRADLAEWIVSNIDPIAEAIVDGLIGPADMSDASQPVAEPNGPLINSGTVSREIWDHKSK